MRKPKEISRVKLYKKYVAYMNDWNRRERFKILLDGVALSLPLLAAFSWYVSLISRSMSPVSSGVYLSPQKIEPIILFVLVFVVIYSIFLMFEYDLLRKRVAKVKKK